MKAMDIKIKKISDSQASKFSKKIWKEFYNSVGVDGNSLKSTKFFIYYNDQITGLINIWIEGHVALLDEFILKPKFRGKGKALDLLKFVKEFAIKNKCRKLNLKTCPDLMPAAYHLYKKFGFKDQVTLVKDCFNKDWKILSMDLDVK
jgi:GNAT superfamily N-acetyltransferase